MLTTPECMRKDLCAYRNCRLTGSWEQRLRSSLKLRRTQQLFHPRPISTQRWCWEPASHESQFISLYCIRGRLQTQAPPLLFLASTNVHISIADAKTGSAFLDHVRTLSQSKISPYTSQARTPKEDRRMSFWQTQQPPLALARNSSWVKFCLSLIYLGKYHLFIFLPWIEDNCCKLPLPFYVEAAHHMR